MHDIKANLYPCAHCSGVGTCKSGQEGQSCAVCVKESELKGRVFIGLPCSICGGIGQAEPKTERINKRMPALLGFFLVFLLSTFVFFAAVTNSNYFSEILAFSGTLIGTVLGFYYSTRARVTWKCIQNATCRITTYSLHIASIVDVQTFVGVLSYTDSACTKARACSAACWPVEVK